MSEYYHISSPNVKPTSMEEIRQFYPNLVEGQNIQYVITTNNPSQTFQGQQVLNGGNQNIIIENQPQVVTQVTYQGQPQLILQQTGGSDQFQEANTQQVYFVEQVDNNQQTEPKPQLQQPVVLNHLQSSLRNQLAANSPKGISPAHKQLQLNQLQIGQIRAERPGASQIKFQIPIRSPIQGIPQRPIIIQRGVAAQMPVPPLTLQSNATDSIPVSISRPAVIVQERSASNTVRAVPPLLQSRPSTSNQIQSRASNMLQHQRATRLPPKIAGQTASASNSPIQITSSSQPSGIPITEIPDNSREAVALEDGTIVTMAQYKKILHEKALLTKSENKPEPSLTTSGKKKTNRTPTPRSNRGKNAKQATPGTSPANKRQSPKSNNKTSMSKTAQNKAMNSPVLLNTQKTSNEANQLLLNNSQSIIRTPAQNIQTPQAQAAAAQARQNQLRQQQMQQELEQQQDMQKKMVEQGMRSPHQIPSNAVYVPSSTLQKIIENSPDTEEFSDSIRMLVLLESGEQRLITFTVPKEQCTIQEILEQVGVDFDANTKIECTQPNIKGINYVVTVGRIQNVYLQTTPSPKAEEKPPEPETQPLIAEEDRSATPEPPKETSKLVPGKLAVCKYCGYLSEDFNRCLRCKRKLPDDAKSVDSSTHAGPQKKLSADANKIVQALHEKKHINITLKSKGAVKPVTSISSPNSKKRAKPKQIEQEPLIVTLSSDDEEQEEDKKTIAEMTQNIPLKLQENSVSLIPVKSKELSAPSSANENSIEIQKLKGVGKEPSPFVSMELFCRTVRIGSYKYIPREKILINSSILKLKIPHPKDEKNIKTIEIQKSHIVKALVSFSKLMPVIFFYVMPSVGEAVRAMLEMDDPTEIYFDPLSKEEQHKRITILPEYIDEEIKMGFKHIFNNPVIMDELNTHEANNLLMKTYPKELSKVQLPHTAFPMEIKQLLIYPPGKGGISINTEDYLCLASDQFLNDVIIDFYLKFIVLNMLPCDKQEKVHVFSTFFYKRLTTKPFKATRRSYPTELDPNLTPAQKRHARVQKWTKNVNLFEKDFIIIPINESSHWFLAIVCFPGIDGCYTWDGKPTNAQTYMKVKKEKKPTPAPMETDTETMTLVKIEKKEDSFGLEDGEASDKDEAEGDDSELDSEEETGELPVEPPKPGPDAKIERVPIKQPCILIFDSLAGASRSRVVATLRDYLTCEYKAKMGKEKVFNKDNIKGACPKVPQQQNFTDCGLYVLQYVESFFLDPIKDYHIPIKQLKDWFEEIIVTKKREDIAILIKELMIKYKKDVNILPEILLPTVDGKIEQFYEDEEEEEFEEEEDMMEEEMRKSESNSSNGVKTESSDDTNVCDSSEETASPIKPSKSNDSSKNFMEQEVSDANILKPDVSETEKPSNQDTLSYLKAKRIIKHKSSDVNDAKKIKLDN